MEFAPGRKPLEPPRARSGGNAYVPVPVQRLWRAIRAAPAHVRHQEAGLPVLRQESGRARLQLRVRQDVTEELTPATTGAGPSPFRARPRPTGPYGRVGRGPSGTSVGARGVLGGSTFGRAPTRFPPEFAQEFLHPGRSVQETGRVGPARVLLQDLRGKPARTRSGQEPLRVHRSVADDGHYCLQGCAVSPSAEVAHDLGREPHTDCELAPGLCRVPERDDPLRDLS